MVKSSGLEKLFDPAPKWKDGIHGIQKQLELVIARCCKILQDVTSMSVKIRSAGKSLGSQPLHGTGLQETYLSQMSPMSK